MANKNISQGLKRAQSRLLNMNSKKILNNVALLYVVLIATISDLLYMVSYGSHFNVIVFIVVAYITSIFSKNMMVILLVSLVLTNMYDMGKKIVLKEGFDENSSESDKDDSEQKESNENHQEKEDDKEDDKEDEVKEDDKEDDETAKNTGKEYDELPAEFKNALDQMSNPETRKTIEGLKELEPMINRIGNIVKMLK